MSRAMIKICGITSPSDAVMCVEAGADYLGVIFAESPRRVTAARCVEIRRAVRGARLVGVFRDAGMDSVRRAAELCGLDMIQLHGSERPEVVAALAEGLGLPIVKALAAGAGRDPRVLAGYAASGFILFDLDKTGAGGSRRGVRALWDEAAAAVGAGHRVFLAGGLTPDNVGEAVRRVRPYAVDVCGGVEAAPGRKDARAVARFMEGARR